MNGERKKPVRYALLKNPDNLREDEKEALMDITGDFESVGTSFKLKSPRARCKHTRWTSRSWATYGLLAAREGTRYFRALAKTVLRNVDGILRAIETEIPDL